MTLRQNFKNHFRVFEFTLTVTAILAVGWWYFDFDPDFLKIAGIYHLANVLPALYLHVEYTSRNWNETIVIEGCEIEIVKNGITRNYRKEDLKKITVVKSASLDSGGIKLSAVEGYHYCRIAPIDGQDIIITCLMTPDIENAIRGFKGVSFERKKKLFCSIEPV